MKKATDDVSAPGQSTDEMTPAQEQKLVEQIKARCADDGFSKSFTASGNSFWLAVLSWIAGSIPLYMMCCCTAKPASQYHGARVGGDVQMVTAKVHDPASVWGTEARSPGAYGKHGQSLLDIEQ